MNRKLLDPFQHTRLPEVIEEFLDWGVTKCVAFNRRGTLLAAGTDDGHVVLWDFDTRGPAKVLSTRREEEPAAAEGDAAQGAAAAAGPGSSKASARRPLSHMVTAVAWSRSGRHLVCTTFDHRAILFDVLSGKQVWEAPLPEHATSVSLSPAAPFLVLACPIKSPPLLLDVASNQQHQLHAIDIGINPEGQLEVTSSPSNGCALFSRGGDLMFMGQHKGLITIFDTASRKILDVFKMPQAVRVLSMTLNRKGTRLLLNCHDKTIRLYEVRRCPPGARGHSLEEVQAVLAGQQQAGVTGSLLLGDDASMLVPLGVSFQDVVNRNSWRGVAFSSDSEYVAGGLLVKDQNQHHLHLWNGVLGKLEKVLEGPRHEGIVDLAWHPTRLLLVSVSTNGRVYIWASVHDENWSAFAPDFKELEENEEYVEAEDEFDINERPAPADGSAPTELQLGLAPRDETAHVDIMSREVVRVFSSDEEDEGEGREAPLHHLPVVIEPFNEQLQEQNNPLSIKAAKATKSSAGAPGAAASPGGGGGAAAAAAEGGGGRRSSTGGGAASGSELQDDGEESGEEEGGEEQGLLVDGPRDRKRRVRFDDEFPDKGTGRRRGRGRGRRPPLGPPRAGDFLAGGLGGWGPAGGLPQYPLAALGGSGSQLNPAALALPPGGRLQHTSLLPMHLLQMQPQQQQQQPQPQPPPSQ